MQGILISSVVGVYATINWNFLEEAAVFIIIHDLEFNNVEFKKF